MRRHIKAENLIYSDFGSGLICKGSDYKGEEICLFKSNNKDIYIVPVSVKSTFMFHTVPAGNTLESNQLVESKDQKEEFPSVDYWDEVSSNIEDRIYFTASPLIACRLLGNSCASVVIIGGWQEHLPWRKIMKKEMRDWKWAKRDVRLVYQPEEKISVKSMGVLSGFRRCLEQRGARISLVEMVEHVNKI